MKLPGPEDRAEAIALFRSQIIGALTRQRLDRGELARELRKLSTIRFRPPDAKATRTYSVPTLERWYYAYRQGGMTALRPRPRSDRGHAQALDEQQRQLICDIRREYPNASAPLILRTLEVDGRIEKGKVSLSTVRRLLCAHDLERAAVERTGHTTCRLRWQAEAPNALWHGDVCHGPCIGPARKKLLIHGLMDDAVRYNLAIEARFSETERDMLEVWVPALRRHGPPGLLYLDNGSTYRGNALRLACERLGITLVHAKPYDAPARGKMERFWATLRAGCLDYLGDCTTLHEVNARLLAFVDTHYHRAPHAGLMGRTPGDVWQEFQRERPADDLDEAKLAKALTVRERRRVRKDSTVRLNGVIWETDAGFLAGRNVTIANCLIEPDSPPWLEYEDQQYPLHPVDPVANSRRKRAPLPTVPATDAPHFDPPGALLDRAMGRRHDHKPSKGNQ